MRDAQKWSICIMGYCSDVALIMKKRVWHEMREHFADNTDVLNTLERAKVIAYRDEYTILSWTFLKWLEPIDRERDAACR